MMTREQQRIAIAEFCGWTMEKTNVHDGKCWHLNGIQSEEAPPDYADDLNAMHEAEMKLDQGQRTRYIFNLQTAMGGMQFGLNYFATAAQRAEALLRTIGKWA